MNMTKAQTKLGQLAASKGLHLIMLIAVLALGAYLRFTGIEWDQDFHLHPDERFLTMVENSLTPVDSLREYFDTNSSTLNPHNVRDANGNQIYPLFVYGDLPIVIVRYAGEWFNMSGYGKIYILGRILSGLFDLGTVLVVFFIGKRLFGKFWPSWLAALLYACSALPIQISHYFIVDNFTTFFAMLAFLAAVTVLKREETLSSLMRPSNLWQWLKLNWPDLAPYVAFGVMLGLAGASKINALAIALLLPLAVFLKDSKGFLRPSSSAWTRHFHFMLIAAVVSFLAFRIFQPYAFQGPGFFGIGLNKEWISDLQELSVLSSGISNYPPSMQWARRSVWFPLKNLTIWGIGFPMAIFAVGGLLWMGWKIVKGEWREYSLIWFWTVFYTTFQAVRWNPTMRYFLLVYPVLAVVAAWCLWQAYVQLDQNGWFAARRKLTGVFKTTAAFVLIVGTVCWALAFIQIYHKPMTRIAASEWIYDNIEGAVNLQLNDDSGDFIQALPYSHAFALEPGGEIRVRFQPQKDGFLSAINFEHIITTVYMETLHLLPVSIQDLDTGEVLVESNLSDSFLPDNDSRGREFNIVLDEDVALFAGKTYELVVALPEESDAGLNLFGSIGLNITNDAGESLRQAVFEAAPALTDGEPYAFSFTAKRDSELSAIELYRVLDMETAGTAIGIQVAITDQNSGAVLAKGKVFGDFTSGEDYRGSNTLIQLNQPLELKEGQSYGLTIRIEEADARVLVAGSQPAKESDWDDTLPLYMYGLNPFDNFDGVYQSDLNFQMYWDDNEDKRQRFISILDQADYIIITSNRQWGSVTQLPEQYPLTTLFYKALIGCDTEDVQYCYRVAQPGMMAGELGYELEAVYQSNPEIFGIEFNSQFAEEAFTVYDHPKVMVFKKTADFDLNAVVDTLYRVDLDKIQSMTPEDAEKYKGDLMLSDEQFTRMQSKGTWSALFDYEALQNKYPFLGVLVWYLTITLLGWIFYPSGRIIFKGLADKGFPLLKLTGLIIWALGVWWLGSAGVSVTRWTVLAVLTGLLLLNFWLGWRNRAEILMEIKQNRKLFLTVELTALAFFAYFLLIRLGNPDLWHPYKGGEKPMDFSYFNAVLKSDTFPPYDPWYAGGYINYYYYGFVLAAMPVKLLGIVPSIAYNLILPTFFSFTAMAAFCFGWNLFPSLGEPAGEGELKSQAFWQRVFGGPLGLALTSAFFVLIVGNLGTIQMIFQGFQKIATAGITLTTGSVFERLAWFFEGIRMYFAGHGFTYYPGDWYWIPSRTIPGEPITEFPYFTFLYGDPHAHMFAYPITILVLCWLQALLKNHLGSRKIGYVFLQLAAGALFIGTLKPTNTWDYPVFLFIAVLVLGYVLFRYASLPDKFFPYLHDGLRRVMWFFLIEALFIGATYLFYYPFTYWFGQAYSAVNIWEGDRTPISSYLTHWGMFIFIIYSFAIREMHEWLATTPVSALKPFYERRNWITAAVVLIIGAVLVLAFSGVQVVLVIAPAILLLVLLFFRPNYDENTRLVILVTLAGLGLTLMVELIAIRGDIGRMNTVFKFYLQAWTFLSLSAAFFLYKLVPHVIKQWHPNNSIIWQVMLGLLLFSTALFPVLASADKITDRISDTTPLTLDGIDYMKYSTYFENDTTMDLSQDYAGIRWMQENIQGSPVILEANVSEYLWGNRYTIYTGLPGVIGWNWHQRQQRAINSSDWVYERINDVNEFYQTDNMDRCEDLINQYDIRYIVVGQLERSLFTKDQLAKFEEQEGRLWNKVFSYQQTAIYQVIE
jgi:YYY domain-containing protein